MVRILGAVLLMAGCGGFGFSLAAAHRREARLLRGLIDALQEMEWELKYRMSDLSEICCVGGDAAGGILKEIFRELAGKLKRREVTDISGCLNAIINRKELPRNLRKNLKQMGSTLGRYDLEGQLQGLESVRRQCKRDLKKLEENSTQRLRSYQTLALCAGAAMAILLI